METYAVYPCAEYSANAAINMTADEVINYIYHYDGEEYRLEPRMLTNRYDDEDNELEDIQDSTQNGNLIFDVYFKYRGSWHKGCRTAIGKNEDEAIKEFLRESFKYQMWEESRWIVLPMKQYLLEQEENSHNT